jgi:release factor glutamine methyltransferase
LSRGIGAPEVRIEPEDCRKPPGNVPAGSREGARRSVSFWLSTSGVESTLGVVTVLEVIQRSTDFLAKKGVESPRLQVELLLAHALGLPRLQLYLNFERTLTEREMGLVRDAIQRRGRREPLQHIIGGVSFCGFEIKVNRDVLVPRPETERLAEHAGSWLSRLEAPAPLALDFGTGSGCLAVVLAANCPRARIHALDISPEAVAVARENAAVNRLAGRITFHTSDGFSGLGPGLSFDLIVANPPYIPRAEIDSLAPEVRDYDPRRALDGGRDGLDFYERLGAEAGARLRPGGRLMVEFGDGQAAGVGKVLEAHNWIVERVAADYTGRARLLAAARQ